MRDIWITSALVLAAVSIFALGYAVNGLADGITELPKHWWSTAPILGLLLAAAIGFVGRTRSRKS